MIKIKQAKNGQLYYVITARNGKVLLTSETYKSRRGLMKGIKALTLATAKIKIVDTTK